MHKDKILAALKTKYKNLGLSDKTLEGVAAMLATTVTEETAIDEAVSGVEDMLKGFQSEADQRVNNAVAKAKKEAEKKPGEKSGAGEEGGDPAKKEEPAKGDDTPAWAKGLMQSVTTLTTEINTLKAGKASETRKQLLEKKLEKANPIFKSTTLKNFNRMKFESDEEFDAYLQEVETDLGEHGEIETEEAITQAGGAPTKAGTVKKGKEASKEEVKAVVDQIM